MKPTKSFLFLILSASLCQAIFAQEPSGVLTYRAPVPIAVKAGGEVKETLSITVAPGYHANSNKPADPYLIPLRLTWNAGPLQTAEIIFPQPRIQSLGFSKTPVSVFTGTFDIVTRFQIAADAAPGKSTVTGKLHYQACDEHSCLTPKTIEVSIPVEILK